MRPLPGGTEPKPDSEPERLPIHRVVFRAMVLGATGGVLGGALMIVSNSLSSATSPRGRDVVSILLIGLVWCGLLAFSEHFVRPLRPARRPVALAFAGALSALALSCCVVATDRLITSGSWTRAWLPVVELLGSLLENETKTLNVGLAILAPFTALGTARIGFARRRPAHLLIQILIAIAGGVVSTLLLSVLRVDFLSPWWFLTFAGGAGAAAAGMSLGEPLERRLLNSLRKRTDPAA